MKLELDGIVKRFGASTVLDGVSLRLESCRVLALIGPSGGGKSTLLRIVAGLERPDDGSVAIDGAPGGLRGCGAPAAPALHRHGLPGVQLVPAPHRAREYHASAGKSARPPAREAVETARQILRRFRLEDHSAKRPAELSGGQRQRVAIARAVAIKPRLLLLDEPTSALDPGMTAEVLETVEELRDEGRDFILITHQMHFARRFADQAALLAGGRIAEAGPSEQVFGAPRTDAGREFLCA